jgi:hypothetical protein
MWGSFQTDARDADHTAAANTLVKGTGESSKGVAPHRSAVMEFV